VIEMMLYNFGVLLGGQEMVEGITAVAAGWTIVQAAVWRLLYLSTAFAIQHPI
jgi:hypothetical protein